MIRTRVEELEDVAKVRDRIAWMRWQRGAVKTVWAVRAMAYSTVLHGVVD